MATAVTLTGTILLPDGTAPQGGQLRFQLTATDTDQTTRDSFAIGGSSFIDLDDGAIPAGTTIWPNTAGLAGSSYDIYHHWIDAEGRKQQRVLAARRTVSDESDTVDIAELIDAGVTAPDNTYVMTITVDEYNAVIDAEANVVEIAAEFGDLNVTPADMEEKVGQAAASASDAEQSASDASASAALAAAFAQQPEDQTVSGGSGYSALHHAAKAAASASAAAASVSALGGGRFVMSPLALKASALTHGDVGEGTPIYAGNYSFEVAAPDATDYHVVTDAGLRLYAMPGEDGAIDLAQFWADTAADDNKAAIDAAMASGFTAIRVSGEYRTRGGHSSRTVQLYSSASHIGRLLHIDSDTIEAAYAQSGTTVLSLTSTAHGLSVGDTINLDLPYGSASGARVATGGHAIGATTINIDAAGSGSIIAGDVLIFDSDGTRTYSVAVGIADVSVGGTITLASGLLKAIASTGTGIIVRRAAGLYTVSDVPDDDTFEVQASVTTRSGTCTVTPNAVCLQYYSDDPNATVLFSGARHLHIKKVGTTPVCGLLLETVSHIAAEMILIEDYAAQWNIGAALMNYEGKWTETNRLRITARNCWCSLGAIQGSGLPGTQSNGYNWVDLTVSNMVDGGRGIWVGYGVSLYGAKVQANIYMKPSAETVGIMIDGKLNHGELLASGERPGGGSHTWVRVSSTGEVREQNVWAVAENGLIDIHEDAVVKNNIGLMASTGSGLWVPLVNPYTLSARKNANLAAGAGQTKVVTGWTVASELPSGASSFDASSGIWTAPFSGVFTFNFSMILSVAAASEVYARVLAATSYLIDIKDITAGERRVGGSVTIPVTKGGTYKIEIKSSVAATIMEKATSPNNYGTTLSIIQVGN